MPYFNYLPDISYDTKPISYPFSESDFVVAKNFFRRFKLSEEFQQYAVFFRQYQIGDFEAPWQVANQFYGSPNYDWVILLTNNIVNPLFDWPMDSYTFRKHLEGKYDDPYATIKHYETFEVKDSTGLVVQKQGLIVDQHFYESPKYIVDNNSSLPQQNIPRQATATIYSDSYVITGVQLDDSGSGYETAPTVEFTSATGSGASATANLSPVGYIKSVNIINGGFGYTYPPLVTLGGGLDGQSATAEIDGNGVVTNINLDGVKFDTTNADQIYEFGNGTAIVPNGDGTGTTGGFDIGSTHLRFGGNSGVRYVTLNPINATAVNQVRVYAIRGNGSNGGETPDINGVEDLYIQYQVTNEGEAPDPNAWVQLGIVIDAVPNGSGSGVLDNYDFNLDAAVQQPHVYFRLYQPGNSGANFDHYGILSVNFIGATATNIADSTITLTTNPLQTTTPSALASAEVIIGKTVESITLNDSGQNYDGDATTISLVGGNFVTPAQASFTYGPEWKVRIDNAGNAYGSATATFTGGGPGNGGDFAGDVIVSNGRVTGISITNQGTNYTDAPAVEISSPDQPITFSVGDVYNQDSNTWKWNGSAWEKLVTAGFKYRDSGTGLVVSPSGSSLCKPVTVFEWEEAQQEKSREIFILKPQYLDGFIDQFRQANKYKDSTDFISTRLKKTGV